MLILEKEMEDLRELFPVINSTVLMDINHLYTTRIYRRASINTLTLFASSRGINLVPTRTHAIQQLAEADAEDRSWAQNALSSKPVCEFSSIELLFRICALFSSPESLKHFPQTNTEIRDRARLFLVVYDIVLEILGDVDLLNLDQLRFFSQDFQKIGIGFSQSSTLEDLYNAVQNGDFSVDDDGYALLPSSGEQSIFVDILTSEYPLLSPSVPSREINWLTAPPRVPFSTFLCTATLALEEPETLKYMLKNPGLSSEEQKIRHSIAVDKNFVNMLLPFELLFCVCRKRFPNIPEPETRKRRFTSLVSYSGNYEVENENKTISFADLLQECYPEYLIPRDFGFLLFVAREMISEDKDFSLPAALTQSSLENKLLPTLQAGEFYVDTLVYRIGMRVPTLEGLDYVVNNLQHYNLIGAQSSDFSTKTDFDLLDNGLVWYTSRPVLEQNIADLFTDKFNIFLLPQSSTSRCNNDEDPVSFDDFQHVVVFGNLESNTCMNISTMLDLMRKENLEAHRGVLNPRTEEPLTFEQVNILLDILEEYQGTLGVTISEDLVSGVEEFYARIYSVEEQFRALSEENKDRLHRILVDIFLAGMYMRGWKGPEEDYPLELEKTFSNVGANQEYEYSRLLVDAQHNVEHLRDILRSMNVYTLQQGDVKQQNRSLMSILHSVTGVCRRMLSNEYIITSYVYRKKLFDEEIPGFDISRFGLTVFSVEEIEQARREGQETEETRAYSRLS